MCVQLVKWEKEKKKIKENNKREIAREEKNHKRNKWGYSVETGGGTEEAVLEMCQ